MLKPSFMLEMRKEFTREGYFLENDFEIISSDKNDTTTVLLKYIYNDQYFISLSIPNSKGSKISGIVAPGDISARERILIDSKYEVKNLIGIWIQRIREEIIAEPLNRQIENQKSQIENIIKNMNKIDDEYFSKDEAEELKLRLANLEKDFKKKIQENESDEENLNKKIDLLEKDIEMLKLTLTSFKKENWIRGFVLRVNNWLKDSDELNKIDNGISLVKSFLTEGN